MWKRAYLENRVLSANPVELINILYEHATLSVQEARGALVRGDIGARAKAIAKAIAILGELESSLDHELGGAIADNLAKLYRYMRERLTAANLGQEDRPLAEVEELLRTLGEAWEQIGRESFATHDTFGSHQEPLQEKTAQHWGGPLMAGFAAADNSSHSWSF
jgi:flagellar protein FliS